MRNVKLMISLKSVTLHQLHVNLVFGKTGNKNNLFKLKSKIIFQDLNQHSKLKIQMDDL